MNELANSPLAEVIQSGGVMFIEPRAQGVAGSYACEARNEHGTISHTFEISVFREYSAEN